MTRRGERHGAAPRGRRAVLATLALVTLLGLAATARLLIGASGSGTRLLAPAEDAGGESSAAPPLADEAPDEPASQRVVAPTRGRSTRRGRSLAGDRARVRTAAPRFEVSVRLPGGPPPGLEVRAEYYREGDGEPCDAQTAETEEDGELRFWRVTARGGAAYDSVELLCSTWTGHALPLRERTSRRVRLPIDQLDGAVFDASVPVVGVALIGAAEGGALEVRDDRDDREDPVARLVQRPRGWLLYTRREFERRRWFLVHDFGSRPDRGALPQSGRYLFLHADSTPEPGGLVRFSLGPSNAWSRSLLVRTEQDLPASSELALQWRVAGEWVDFPWDPGARVTEHGYRFDELPPAEFRVLLRGDGWSEGGHVEIGVADLRSTVHAVVPAPRLEQAPSLYVAVRLPPPEARFPDRGLRCRLRSGSRSADWRSLGGDAFRSTWFGARPTGLEVTGSSGPMHHAVFPLNWIDAERAVVDLRAIRARTCRLRGEGLGAREFRRQVLDHTLTLRERGRTSPWTLTQDDEDRWVLAWWEGADVSLPLFRADGESGARRLVARLDVASLEDEWTLPSAGSGPQRIRASLRASSRRDVEIHRWFGAEPPSGARLAGWDAAADVNAESVLDRRTSVSGEVDVSWLADCDGVVVHDSLRGVAAWVPASRWSRPIDLDELDWHGPE